MCVLVPKSRRGDPETSGRMGNKPSPAYTKDRGEATLGKPVLLQSPWGCGYSLENELWEVFQCRPPESRMRGAGGQGQP